MDFLRDTIWQSVGTIIGFIALIVTIIIFRVQKQRKKLSYEIIANSTLIGETVKNELSDKLQIKYKGKDIQNLRIIVFKIYNSGNVTIVSSDFETPIEIAFKENCEVLDAAVISTKPKELQAIVEAKKNKIDIKPLLLNSDDELRIKLLVSNYSPEINFTARIAGVKEITLAGDSSFLSSLPYLLFGIYAFGGFAGAQAALVVEAIYALFGWELPTLAGSLINLCPGFFFTFIALMFAIYAYRKVKQALS